MITSSSPASDQTIITWETSSETDLLGFNLYRSGVRKERVLLNSELISGLTPGSSVGQKYSFLDMDFGSAAYYWLEEIGLNGGSQFHGPVFVQVEEDQEEESPPNETRDEAEKQTAGSPPVVPEASTLLLLGSAVSDLAGYIGLQVRARRK